MTFDIDEATDFCKHKASNYKRMSVDAGTMGLKPEEARFEEECKRYEQLAEWLKELKSYREYPKPIVVFPSGEKIILTNGHIQALCDYEKEQMAKDIIERFMKGLENNT